MKGGRKERRGEGMKGGWEGMKGGREGMKGGWE